MNCDRAKIQKTAAWKILFGSIGCAIVLGIVIKLVSGGHNIHGPVGLFVVPFAYGCVGLVELITGIQFQQLASGPMGAVASGAAKKFGDHSDDVWVCDCYLFGMGAFSLAGVI